MKPIYLMLMIVAGVMIISCYFLEPYAYALDARIAIFVLLSTACIMIGTVAFWMFDDKEKD